MEKYRMQNAVPTLEIQKLAESLNKKLLLQTRTLAFLAELEAKFKPVWNGSRWFRPAVKSPLTARCPR